MISREILRDTCQCMQVKVKLLRASFTFLQLSRFVGESTGNQGLKNIKERRRRTSKTSLPGNSPQGILYVLASVPIAIVCSGFGTSQPHWPFNGLNCSLGFVFSTQVTQKMNINETATLGQTLWYALKAISFNTSLSVPFPWWFPIAFF